MGIIKFYEVSCDNCGEGDFPPGSSKRRALGHYLAEGGVYEKGKIFCSEACRIKFSKNINITRLGGQDTAKGMALLDSKNMETIAPYSDYPLPAIFAGGEVNK